MDYRKLAEYLLRGGDKHSAVYIEGMSAALQLRIDGTVTPCPYADGCIQYDAYYYGCSRGAAEWNNAYKQVGQDRAKAIESFREMADARRAA